LPNFDVVHNIAMHVHGGWLPSGARHSDTLLALVRQDRHLPWSRNDIHLLPQHGKSRDKARIVGRCGVLTLVSRVKTGPEKETQVVEAETTRI
jgi:hypothetical protein